jgi:hypothetical protein
MQYSRPGDRAEHGWLVEPESDEALTAAIETLYSDAELRMLLSADGLQAVQQSAMERVAG